MYYNNLEQLKANLTASTLGVVYIYMVMATSTNITTSRFDGKLDALLRRELSQSEYERLVATEVCISVPRGSGKRTHGHVIIGPSHLYFAPIPVKKIRLLLALSDILSVAVVRSIIGRFLRIFKLLGQKSLYYI